jgi:predicted glycogen debranching enzyme
MIALPGLTLATGRPDIAANILRTFASFVSDGLLPNRFPDGADAPEYNTVDATLWYFVAIDEYVRASGDRKLLEELFPVLRSIVRWHQRGTRHGICVDEQDGLLRAGEDGVQLSWMDAKIGDWVVTPRTGKAVEINALWFNALAIMRDFAQQLGDAEAAREYGSASERVARSFDERFWYAEGGYLYDVIDSPAGEDASLRPNQIFAVSLRHPLLENGRAKAVIDKCMHELWTPVGLRSLAPTDPRYVSHYGGSPHERDASYHQGTVWSWLLGPFALAHYRIYNDAPAALALLNGMTAHLRDACVGQVSEIFDAEAPFASRGCFAQAWGVAETLRAWSEINDSEAQTRSSKARKHAATPRK